MKTALLRSAVIAGMAVTFMPYSIVSANAAGESTFVQPKPKATKAKKKSCKRGHVYSKRLKKCVRKTSSVIQDEDKYWTGARLAKNGDYREAIAVLQTVSNQDDPRVLNYMGYANRKLGRFDVGLSYYHKALSIDPNYTLTRAYLGEAYVHLGKMDLAKEQLREIEKRVGSDTYEYRELDRFIRNAA
ncbi:tetratricopeptide repeat protein [Coralliovum pocilloporae]|uniref:tetratricopeptide repeat protein n=1 Tax=Coralliovum pocilloporae TaxID=3066369 RepID=UPI003307086B